MGGIVLAIACLPCRLAKLIPPNNDAELFNDRREK